MLFRSERPGLQLEIEGSADAAADRTALRRLKLEKEFRTKKWTALRKTERAQLTPEQVELAPGEYNEYLKQAHAAAFSPEAIAARAARTGVAASPSVAAVAAPAGSAVPRPAQTEVLKGATALIKDVQRADPRLPTQDLEGQLFETIEISESDFSLLANERAKRVKEYLLQNGRVEPERVFMAEKGDNTRAAKGSRAYLHLR